MNEIYITKYRLVQDVKPHYVYTVEVVSDCLGLNESVEKRYSAFHSLHRERILVIPRRHHYKGTNNLLVLIYHMTRILFEPSPLKLAWHPVTPPLVKGKNYLILPTLLLKLRKQFQTPAFPPKRVRCSQPKILEQRRQGLERYLQIMFKFAPSRTQVMAFLGISRPTTITQSLQTNFSHQPVFQIAPVSITRRSSLPDIITEGVLSAIYGYSK